MQTAATHIRPHGHWAFNALLITLALVLAGALTITFSPGAPRDSEELEGRAPTPIELTPGVQAAFPRQSYRPGSVAALVLYTKERGLKLQLFHAGPEHHHTYGYNEMQGIPVTAVRAIGSSNGHRSVRVKIGNWPSGLYFARLSAANGRIGFAPFVLRPSRLGEHRVAVVMPTLTWQAYNLRDDNHDGTGDTWYADWDIHTALLGRPFLNRGVPYMFRRYDLPFLNWLAQNGHTVDYLSDSDLYSTSGAVLARAYDLLIFPGHHEYVTTHEYDVVQSYRDRGGNLMYLSANNFFWRTVLHGQVMTRTEQWRDLGRPEAALVGTQYRGNARKFGPWIARHVDAVPWLFAGTGLHDGSRFAMGGIEIDKTAKGSPRNVHVVAEIPNLFGPGFTAQMTYYETPKGAKVFAAGAFTMAGSVFTQPVIGQMVDNLWTRLSQP